MSLAVASDLARRLDRSGVVAVQVVENVEDAVGTAKALLEGGITAMEVTLRSPESLPALEAIRNAVPEMLTVAGTVRTEEQLRTIHEMGLELAVAPGFNPGLVRLARELGMAFVPGVMTPSEMDGALGLGCQVLKFFPAEAAGGLSYLETASAPFRHEHPRFIPLGGVKLNNLETYLKHPLILAAGGSWLAPQDLVREQRWSAITDRAKMAREMAVQVRGS